MRSTLGALREALDEIAKVVGIDEDTPARVVDVRHSDMIAPSPLIGVRVHVEDTGYRYVSLDVYS